MLNTVRNWVMLAPARWMCSTQYSVLNTEHIQQRRVRVILPTLLLAWLLSLACRISAQEGPTRLMDQPPFDVITLDKTNESKVYKVYPLRLPGRKVPEKPKPTDKVRVK